MTHRRRGFVQPVLPDSPVIFSAAPTFETQRVSRGKHRLLSAHDRQIYGARHRRIEDFILCCGLVPTIPRLKSACPLPFGTGHTCTSTRAFASGFLQAHIAVPPLPLATLRLRQAGSGLCLICVSYYQTSPFSSRAKPGTHRDREEPRSSPLPHHAAYGSVLRDSADQARSTPGERKPE
jgi:hypothetical protein